MYINGQKYVDNEHLYAMTQIYCKEIPVATNSKLECVTQMPRGHRIVLSYVIDACSPYALSLSRRQFLSSLLIVE